MSYNPHFDITNTKETLPNCNNSKSENTEKKFLNCTHRWGCTVQRVTDLPPPASAPGRDEGGSSWKPDPRATRHAGAAVVQRRWGEAAGEAAVCWEAAGVGRVGGHRGWVAVARYQVLRWYSVARDPVTVRATV